MNGAAKPPVDGDASVRAVFEILVDGKVPDGCDVAGKHAFQVVEDVMFWGAVRRRRDAASCAVSYGDGLGVRSTKDARPERGREALEDVNGGRDHASLDSADR